jgi:RNA polymerase sigma factor (TIGR02999 family)
MTGREEKVGDVTALLADYRAGDSASLNEVVSMVYAELKRQARSQLHKSSVGHELNTTMLVHETYAKLASGKTLELNDRRHFMAIAARAMRQIVIDTYRTQTASKRGGLEVQRFELQTGDLIDHTDPHQVAVLGDVIEELVKHDPELVAVLDMHCFAGLTAEQIAEINETHLRTVQRQLAKARAWVSHMME